MSIAGYAIDAFKRWIRYTAIVNVGYTVTIEPVYRYRVSYVSETV